MDILDEDLLKFWAGLNKCHVQYIMVGGFAVNLHGHTRATKADIMGVKVPFLHINHLIANKRIVNRPKDQVDVIELEKIRQILRSDQSSSK